MEFLEVPLFDDDVFKLLVRLVVDLLVVTIVVMVCYRRVQQKQQYVFTFIVLNIMVFFICFALKKLELELGLALGLFAIFGIIRYRTESIGVHEMTYLFVIVGIAVINSLSNKKTSYVELAATNGVIILATFVLERISISTQRPNANKGKRETRRGMAKQSVVYDNLNLLAPGRRQEMIQDIANRIGIAAEEIEVSKIDLSKGVAMLNVYYKVDNSAS